MNCLSARAPHESRIVALKRAEKEEPKTALGSVKPQKAGMMRRNNSYTGKVFRLQLRGVLVVDSWLYSYDLLYFTMHALEFPFYKRSDLPVLTGPHATLNSGSCHCTVTGGVLCANAWFYPGSGCPQR